MPRVGVQVCKYNSDGVIVQLVGDDGIDTVDLVKWSTKRDAKLACASAAHKLEKLASIAREIGKSDEPFKSATHNKINGFNIDG